MRAPKKKAEAKNKRGQRYREKRKKAMVTLQHPFSFSLTRP
jgi:hypothetical protein